MSFATAQTIQSGTAVITNGASALVFNTGGHDGSTLSVLLNVSAVSGTPSLVASIQWSNDAVTWFDSEVPDSFAVITTPKKVAKTFDIKAEHARLSWVITGGSPSVTLDASGYVG